MHPSATSVKPTTVACHLRGHLLLSSSSTGHFSLSPLSPLKHLSLIVSAIDRYLATLQNSLVAHDLLIMKVFYALPLLPLLASATPIIDPQTIHKDAAPVLSSSNAQEIPDSYIVVFKKDVSHSTAALHHDWVHEQHTSCMKAKRDLHKRDQTVFTDFGGLKHTYNIAGGLLGYSGHFDEEVIERVRRHPDVSTACIFPYRAAST